MYIDRTPVSSSNIASIGYDAGQMILQVEFLNGRIYNYYNVPENLHIGLMNADSHGKYLNRYIKQANFNYEQIS